MKKKQNTTIEARDTDTICNNVDCEMINNLNFFYKPTNYYDSYDDFAEEFLKIMERIIFS